MPADAHPLGLPWGPDHLRCGGCVWAQPRGPGPRVLRCRAGGDRRVDANERACVRHEAQLDCLECAACCGPAFDAVEVGPRDPVRQRAPEWIVRRDGRFQVPRTPDNHCACLQSDNRCRIYDARPQCCRDFTQGSANCLFARRRSGRSAPFR